MSNYETITIEKRGAVALLTINRPDKLNALNMKVHEEGVAAMDGLKSDDSVRVVVLTGSGEKAFIAGADISEFVEATPVAQRDLFHERTLFNTIDTFPKPVIAMINGFCLGGGNELALACDIRIGSEKARFSQPEINLGIMPGGGGTQRLARLIGEGRAMELCLLGDMIDAETAYKFGLLNRVFPIDQLEEETMKIAEMIAEKAPIALQLTKEAVKFASRSNLDEGLRREVDLFAICFSTEDKKEGVSAFLEKRKPVFQGK
ncbi:MAG: enoyl-CoA hydratase/isomerase family protein [Pyrinomonadaceae bacterium]|nr:enoyl-CoA hydratase/isomerase family protein [Blastocatellia bacterium]MCW5958021.1 enoyl-CoA hydratase/isomerase family protein [Pyrinomonadaceae bacterium]